MAERPSRRVHGRGGILCRVLHFKILTLSWDNGEIKRILLCDSLWVGGGGGGGGERRGEERREEKGGEGRKG